MPESLAVPRPSRREIRDYLLDMIAQLASLARVNGEKRIAGLLEDILVAEAEATRKN